MNHQPSNEKCQLGNEKLSPPLFTYWLALCGRPRWEQHTASNGMISLGGKRAVTVNLVGGCGIAINEGGEKKHKQNKSIIGPTVWNHTLSKLVLKQSILHQLLYNLLLKLFSPLLFFHSSVYVRFNSTLHGALQGLLHSTAIDKRDQSDWKRERKSAWRIQSFHLLSISYSNAAIML